MRILQFCLTFRAKLKYGLVRDKRSYYCLPRFLVLAGGDRATHDGNSIPRSVNA